MTEEPPLKLAFIGGSIDSAIGTTHEVASKMDGRWRLEAGCFSLDTEINLRTAEHWRIDPSRTYVSSDDLLQSEAGHIDAVVVLTPTPSHCDIICAALMAGIPVISEKALAVDSAEVKKIQQCLEDSKGFLAVTYNYTAYPMVRELQHLVENGHLGRILHLQMEMPQEGFIRLDSAGKPQQHQAWRLEDKNIPTVSLDLGIHLHNLVSFVTAFSPESVSADYSSYGYFDNIVDNISVMARYNNEMKCQFWYGKSALGHSNGLRIRVYGKEGSAEWYQLSPEILRLSFADGSSEILERGSRCNVASAARYNRFKPGHMSGFLEAFANYYYDLADELTLFKKNSERTSSYIFNSPYVFSLRQAYEGIRFLEAIDRSYHSGKWEKVF